MHKVAGNEGGAATLPASLWAVILQHVPQQQRLTQCALVSRAWSRYAAQATLHVDLELDEAAVPALLSSWLAVHAGQVLSLRVFTSRYVTKTLQLPLNQLTKLQRLELRGITLQLPCEDASPPGSCNAGSSNSKIIVRSSHAARPAHISLHELELDGVILASLSSLLQLTRAPQLTSLVLRNITLTQPQFSSAVGGAAAATDAVAAAIACLLQQLPQLSVLHMPDFPFRDAAMQQIAAMSRLQDILISTMFEPACDLQQLPSSLTKLQLFGIMSPELPQLTGLQRLQLDFCGVPSVLGTLTQLQVLSLCHCTLQPSAPAGTAALLGALHKLTRLQELGLRWLELDVTSIAPQQFSALTASSNLTQLSLTQRTGPCLPKGAVQCMFPCRPGRQMQALQRLTISTEGLDDWCLDSDGLLSITNSCPQLRHIHVAGSVQQGSDLSLLLQLPESCTSLCVGGEAFSDECMHVLLQLPKLQELHWEWSPALTDLGLKQLTVLSLRKLYVYQCGLSHHLADEHKTLLLESTTHLGSVSQQLDALCDSSPVCMPVRLKRVQGAFAGCSSKGG